MYLPIYKYDLIFLGDREDTLDDLSPEISKYEDFDTIDWMRDIARYRMRHRLITKNKQDGICEKIMRVKDDWSGWVCVLLVGVVAGTYMYNVKLQKDY